MTSYAHHVFKAFDVNSTGSISFRVIITYSPPFWYMINKHVYVVHISVILYAIGHAGVSFHTSSWKPLWKTHMVRRFITCYCWRRFLYKKERKKPLYLSNFTLATKMGFLEAVSDNGNEEEHQMQFIMIWDGVGCTVVQHFW